MLNEGKAAFFGTTEQLKNQFQNEQGSISLEDIFFLATEGRPVNELDYAEQNGRPSFATTA